MLAERPQPTGGKIEMVPSLRGHEGHTPGVKRADDVVQDEGVPPFVVCD